MSNFTSLPHRSKTHKSALRHRMVSMCGQFLATVSNYIQSKTQMNPTTGVAQTQMNPIHPNETKCKRYIIAFQIQMNIQMNQIPFFWGGLVVIYSVPKSSPQVPPPLSQSGLWVGGRKNLSTCPLSQLPKETLLEVTYLLT